MALIERHVVTDSRRERDISCVLRRNLRFRCHVLVLADNTPNLNEPHGGRMHLRRVTEIMLKQFFMCVDKFVAVLFEPLRHAARDN